MKVEADDLQTNETDDRGRIYLGTEYANKRVTVAVVEVESDRPDEDELAAAYRDAPAIGERLAEEWDEASGGAWDEEGEDEWDEEGEDEWDEEAGGVGDELDE